MLVFLRATGMRPCELRRLEWSQIREELRSIVQEEHKTADSTGQPRRVIVNATMVKLLSWFKRHANDGPETLLSAGQAGQRFVFVSSKGKQWTSRGLGKMFQALRRKAKLPSDCKMYGTRHAFATHAILNGVDLQTVATLMGHRSINTTQRYLHLANKVDHLARAADIAGRIKPKGGA